MKVRCLIERPAGSDVEWKGVTYRFLPPTHTCLIEDEEFLDWLGGCDAYELIKPPKSRTKVNDVIAVETSGASDVGGREAGIPVDGPAADAGGE